MTIDGFDGGGTREGCLPLANLQLSAFQAQQHASPTNWVGATGHKPQLGSLLRPEPTIAPEFDQESPCPPVKAKPHPYDRHRNSGSIRTPLQCTTINTSLINTLGPIPLVWGKKKEYRNIRDTYFH